MAARTTLRAMIIGIVAVMLIAPPVLADTCCANVPVELDPTAAKAGDTVKLIGLECRNADNSGPNPLRLGSFWLATTDRAAETDPDSTPGEGLPQVLPPTDEWLAFDSVPDVVTGPGDATVTVPDLADGRYQLWWWCDDGSGPGGGIHYSTGSRLVIGVVPDTATEAAIPSGGTSKPGWPVGILLALGVVVLVGGLRHPYANGRRVRHGADAGPER